MPSASAPHDTATPSRRLTALLLLLALSLTFLLYQPGLDGGFQFDDYSNLHPLEKLGDAPTADQLSQFVLQGIASPVGRPLSLLSFAAQTSDWPNNPEGFIRVNLLLHLANGALLFWWLMCVTQLRGDAGLLRRCIPLAATALWLIAPIQASSVLYVVQRMTELAATFVFLGLGLYLTGRQSLLRGSRITGYGLMGLGLFIGAGLGTLAKENAAQLPLMVLVLEFTLLATVPRSRGWWLCAWPFLVLPSVALISFMVWAGASGYSYSGREFTAIERLLTEPRVLWMYLYKMLAPWPSGIRLWYDDFGRSTGLFTPWTTLASLLGLAAAAAAAWKLRTRTPLLSFAVLWFLACHVLESSALALELVFEHRNYQASAGPLLALAAGGVRLIAHASSPIARTVFATLIAGYLALQAIVTSQIASLWARPLELAAMMAARVPDSQRSAQSLISGLMRYQLPFDAALRAEAAAQRWPDNPSFPLMRLMLSCQVREIPHPSAADLLHRLRTTRSSANTALDYLDNLVSLLEAGHCPIGLPVKLTDLTTAALENPRLRVQHQNQLLLHSRALKVEGRRVEALDMFRRAVDARPQMILLIQGVIDSVEAGDLPRAREYLERCRTDPRVRQRDRWSHRNDIPLLEDLVRSREAAAATP